MTPVHFCSSEPVAWCTSAGRRSCSSSWGCSCTFSCTCNRDQFALLVQLLCICLCLSLSLSLSLNFLVFVFVFVLELLFCVLRLALLLWDLVALLVLHCLASLVRHLVAIFKEKSESSKMLVKIEITIISSKNMNNLSKFKSRYQNYEKLEM